MNETGIIKKAAGILIQDRKLLVEKSKSKSFFIAPGGKVEPGETDTQALIRELFEEFKVVVKENDLEEFGTFKAQAAGNESRMVSMHCFIVKSWDNTPAPNNEVEQIRWITSDIPKDIRVGSIFEHEVIPKLKDLGLID